MNGTRERRPNLSIEQISLVAYPVENRIGLFVLVSCCPPLRGGRCDQPDLRRGFNLMFDASPLHLVERGVFMQLSKSGLKARLHQPIWPIKNAL